MRSNDTHNSREQIRQQLFQAVRADDTQGFVAAMDSLCQLIGDEVRADYDQQVTDLRQELDSRILAARGVRQLTAEERTYYTNLAQAMRAPDPKQALANPELVLPRTVVDAVFDDLRTNHPLLSKINFIPTGGAIEMIVNTDGYQQAVWGQLTDEIVKELISGFKSFKTDLKKLTAFILVSKSMLDLGPEWMDRYVRECLAEAYANGLEAGIVDGDGNNAPIGMTRQMGDGVAIVGGVYPKKPAIKVRDFGAKTVGSLVAKLAINENGKPRKVQDIILLCHPVDYYEKVMPATTMMAPDGTYRNDVMPIPMSILPTMAVDSGEAAFGDAKLYAAFAGMGKDGKIDYSDHARFLQDERAYVAKGYCNGQPKDNSSFLRLDISELQPLAWKVDQIVPAAISTDATLASLTLGNAALNTAFVPGTKTYTATTTSATNTIKALPADAGASVVIKVGDEIIENGTAAEWKAGANTVTITVTAADGKTTNSYTVTVTKS